MGRPTRSLLLLLICCAGCSNETVKQAASQLTPTPPSVSEWKTSEDGTLSFRITAPETQLQPSEPIPLVAELRNNSESVVEVLRPCGDWYYAVAAGIDVVGPQGKLDYSGPTPSYVLGVDSFYRLQPNEVIEDRLEVTLHDFAGIDSAGQYTTDNQEGNVSTSV